MIAPRQFDNADDLKAHYAALRRKMDAPRPIAVAQVQSAPEKATPDVIAITYHESTRFQALQDQIDLLTEDRDEAHREIERLSLALKKAEMQAESYASMKVIIEAVSEEFCVSVKDIKSHSKVPRAVRARQAAMYLCRELTIQSFPSIARAIGDRDHSTVIHGHRLVSSLVTSDPDYAAKVDAAKARVQGGAQ
jgi:chromosomal replication initiator protein